MFQNGVGVEFAIAKKVFDFVKALDSVNHDSLEVKRSIVLYFNTI